MFIFGDDTDFVDAEYVGPDASLGCQISSMASGVMTSFVGTDYKAPAGTFTFQYLLTTDVVDDDEDIDFGFTTVETDLELREGPKITDHFLPDDSGVTTDVDVIVYDTPEPGSLLLLATGTLAILWRLRHSASALRR